MSFEAKYSGGECWACGEPIQAGQLIESTDRHGHGVWQHTQCPDPPPEKPTRFQGKTLEEMGFG